MDELDTFAKALKTTKEALLSDSDMTVTVNSPQGGQNGNYQVTNHTTDPLSEHLIEENAFYRKSFQQLFEQQGEHTRQIAALLEQVTHRVCKNTC